MSFLVLGRSSSVFVWAGFWKTVIDLILILQQICRRVGLIPVGDRFVPPENPDFLPPENHLRLFFLMVARTVCVRQPTLFHYKQNF